MDNKFQLVTNNNDVLDKMLSDNGLPNRELPDEYNIILYSLCYAVPFYSGGTINAEEIIRMLDNIEYFLKFKKRSYNIIDYVSYPTYNRHMCYYDDLFNDDFCTKANVCFKWLNVGLMLNADLRIV